MSDAYIRCHYIDDANLQCESWFRFTEGLESGDIRNTRCNAHGGIPDLQNNKTEYLARVNGEQELCSKMTLDELDVHIANIEKLIVEQRSLLLAARATRSGKIEKLTEQEIAERRKIKIKHSVDFELKQASKPSKPKSMNIVDDSIEDIMRKYKITKEQAEQLKGLSK